MTKIILIKGVRGNETVGNHWYRGCMDQEFSVRYVCEKYLANGKDVFWAFIDLEKAYDTIDRQIDLEKAYDR